MANTQSKGQSKAKASPNVDMQTLRASPIADDQLEITHPLRDLVADIHELTRLGARLEAARDGCA
jgi:hypothetical protein